jgi:hypothetical protein
LPGAAAGLNLVNPADSGPGGYAGSAQPGDLPAVTLTSNHATAVLGQPLTLTATVSAPDGGTPTGAVVFTDGTAVLGSAAPTPAGWGRASP